MAIPIASDAYKIGLSDCLNLLKKRKNNGTNIISGNALNIITVHEALIPELSICLRGIQNKPQKAALIVNAILKFNAE